MDRPYENPDTWHRFRASATHLAGKARPLPRTGSDRRGSRAEVPSGKADRGGAAEDSPARGIKTDLNRPRLLRGNTDHSVLPSSCAGDTSGILPTQKRADRGPFLL